MGIPIVAAICFFLVGSVNTASTQDPRATAHGTLDQLLVALNTTEPIWMLKRSYNVSGHSCVHSVKEWLNGTYYKFTQYYVDQTNGPKSERLQAQLISANGKTEGGVMIVSKVEGSQQEMNYTLHTWIHEEKCGTLAVKDHTGVYQCEMYVWSGSVHKNLTRCNEEYNYCTMYMRQPSQDVYNNNCLPLNGC
ncbi:uncharacterized protein LOC125947821 [Dermacentor silvarum]|uniref:uncharacterized protein LOC125947821 n=1 Tax=Dermacentor silvarum TaxID=543639 RepID=UPI002101BA46|nr:uncharacterized protein LOC125947821 [Dermacentor silvarum]